MAGGSSPLARGLPYLPSRSVAAPGIIPARAGFTEQRSGPTPEQRDHPRSRGVYVGSSRFLSGFQGSSPLARGLRAGRRREARSGGIIPARAGFTRPCGGSPGGASDHPRSRGVYARLSPGYQNPTRSSPLARGLRTLRIRRPVIRRIIPARAGFTTRPCSSPRPGRGSSPLARGLRSRPAHAQTAPRIIPARAGFTRPTAWCWPSHRDHPRSRGVYDGAQVIETGRSGSSPLARGLRVVRGDAAKSPGIIPARAGFTYSHL